MNPRNYLLCLLAAIFTTPVSAQSVLEEVVVTAQRREQNLQEVPVSVTAFTGAAIEQGNIRGATDFLALTPNVAFTEDGQSGARGLGIGVRGVNNLVTGENAVINSIGIYLDEFSIASVPNGVANPFLPDMERLEVLRGPQGTFFGRNAVGGALNLTSKDSTDEFGYKLTVGGESYEDANEMFSITGVVNGALSDNFRARAVLFYEDSGGLVDNICATGSTNCANATANGFTPNGAQDSGHEYMMARVKTVWDISESTTIKTTFIYDDQDQGTDENVPSGILDVDSVDTFGIQAAIDPGTGFWPNNRNQLAHDLNESNELETIVAVVNVNHEINDKLTLKWISGLIDVDQTRLFDNDLIGGADLVERENLYTGFSWSTELRLESTGDSIDWVVGLMYAKDDVEQENNVNVGVGAELGHTAPGGVGLLPPFPPNLGLALNSKNFEVESKAIFADLTFHMTENLDLIAGGRFTADEVKNNLRGNGIGPTCCFPGSPGFPGGPGFAFFNSFASSPRPPVDADNDFTDFAPRLGFRLQLNDNANIYAMASKGYKAGGSTVGNRSDLAGSPATALTYKKEVLWNYEFGMKTELFDNRLRLNGAIFHSEWEDMQFESFRFLVPGSLASNFEQFVNIGKAEANGIELEFVAVPTDNLTITGGFGYLDTEIKSADIVEITGGYNVNLQGLPLPKAPEFTASIAAEYRWPIGNNEAWGRVEFIHRDGQYSDIEGLTNLQTRGPSPNQGLSRPVGPGEFPYLSPDYEVVNLRAGYDMDNWAFNVYIQNVLDEEYYTGTQENFGASGIRLRPHPRIFGGSVSYSFGGI
ncbi:MAG: TonB-dependent receptor [Gammaproteobacteria bacterium]|nr:TonB-dependent receptor [Gammaproteobacteria bacterium]